MEQFPKYTCSHIFLDFIVAIIQIAETVIDLVYFWKLSFVYGIMNYLVLVFLFLNPLTQFIFSNFRLCSYKGCFKLFKCFKKYGLFYEKIKISDCGYFSKITANTSDIALFFLYLFAPLVLAFIFASLLINMTYVLINWTVSLVIYIVSIFIITVFAAIFCVLKLDLLLYPACTEVVASFYFISSKKAKCTDDKMLSTKKICVFLQIFFQTIPLLIILIINDNKSGYFNIPDNSVKVVIFLNIALSSANIAISSLQIICLSKYIKTVNSPYENILRETGAANRNFSKKDTEIMVIQSLDVLPLPINVAPLEKTSFNNTIVPSIIEINK